MSETIADRVRKRLATLQMSPYAASIKASDGRSKDLVKNILNGRSHNPRADTIQRLASALGVSVEWLLHGDGPSEPQPLTEAPTSNARIADLQSLSNFGRGPRDLPVMGTAAGSLGKGSFQFEGGIIDYVARPAALIGIKDAYGIYVEGDSMYPAHEHGDLRLVHPHRPCQIGDTVIIVAKYSEDGPTEAWIKRLVKRSGDRIIVQQYNPVATIEFDRRFVQSCHKVLTLNDLLGI